MLKNKSRLITVFLVVLIVLLLLFVFYIVNIINKTDNGSGEETVINKQTKAVGSTYRKTININEGAKPQEISGNVIPSTFLTGNPISPTETLLADTRLPTISKSPDSISITNAPTTVITQSLTVNSDNPTPTEIIIAYRSTNDTGTQSSSTSAFLSPTKTVSSTKIASLPESGFINNSLILFAVSVMTIFFAFIF